MNYSKVLFLDTETTSLDPTIASIRELAYVKEVNGKQVGDIQSYKISPIIHYEDQLYCDQTITDFCRDYNKKFHDQDPDRLGMFSFPGGEPLFFYSKAVLTFNVTPPDILNPADWLLGTDKVQPRSAIMDLIEYLTEDNVPGRWILAGHNVKYDFDVITYWAKRVLGADAKMLLDKFNKYVFLDTLALSRWFQYSGRLKTDKANLGAVAGELGIDVSDMHSANADVFASKEIARILLSKEYIDDNR